MDGDIAIGHSLGGLFWLDWLEQTEKYLKALFLVATPNPLLDRFNPGDDKIFRTKIESFSSAAQSRVGNVRVFESDNDPYIPVGTGKKIAEILGGDYRHIENAGHFNADFGYDSFPLILNQILEDLS
ncbi:alpha/beta hydrolase [Candidatus Saccharibacteria bacterium]|jgi:predicted alpha/beta hydrolase family esterase|nr:alpha/beta hydrolase [Candidatus Saccharibacteria bacterium]